MEKGLMLAEIIVVGIGLVGTIAIMIWQGWKDRRG